MPSPLHLILRLAACLSVSSALAGCGTSDSRAKHALEDYQAATASNDLAGARKALLELVSAKEDVPDYWVELGKLQASTGSYSDAYYAFTRAYELNRTDPNILSAITELALRSGDLGGAEKHARELEIVSPGNPWIKVTDGWAAIKELQFEDALTTSDQMLANLPNNPGAIVLKSRALMGLKRDDEAESLLSKQVQSQPSDVDSGQMLAGFYVRREQWVQAAQTLRGIASQTPNDTEDRVDAGRSGFSLRQCRRRTIRFGSTSQAERRSRPHRVGSESLGALLAVAAACTGCAAASWLRSWFAAKADLRFISEPYGRGAGCRAPD